MGPDRPFWVGFICWVLILFGSLTIYYAMKELGTTAFDDDMSIFPYSMDVAKTILFGTATIFVVMGICMYERQGWARPIYLVTGVVFLFQRYITHHHIMEKLRLHPLPPGKHNFETPIFALIILFYIFSAIMLYTLRARRYFNPPMYVDE